MGGGLVSLHLKQNQCKYNIYNFDGFIQWGVGGWGSCFFTLETKSV